MSSSSVAKPGSSVRIAVLLATAAAIAYMSNLTLVVGADVQTHLATAASWITQGNPDLDEYVGRMPLRVQQIGSHLYSIYPPGTATLDVFPVLVALAAGIPIEAQLFVALGGKLYAVLAVALSVAFVYLASARVARPLPALIATVAYAFGTSVWSTSSQQFWEHAPSHLFVALGTYLLVRTDRWGARAGLAYGIATVIRPTEVVVAAFGALVSGRRKDLVPYVAWGLPAVAFLFSYNLLVFGTIRQSYPDSDLTFSFPPPGWLGLLVSPSRGLFVYSPVLVFALIGFIMAWRSRCDRAASVVRDASLAVAGVYAVYASIGYWWGGWSYGDRYLSDVGPLFALGIAFAIDRGLLRSIASRVAFGATFAWSFLLQFAGAGWYYEYWNGYHWDVARDIGQTPDVVWDWTDTLWGFVLRHMVFDPGFHLVPSLLGVAGATVLVWRALGAARETAASAPDNAGSSRP
jgi:hypothetical protein